MEIREFVQNFANQFDETDAGCCGVYSRIVFS